MSILENLLREALDKPKKEMFAFEDLKSLQEITPKNFYKSTIAIFDANPPNKEFQADYISTSGSEYMLTDEGVYRKSDHWGVVGSCLWILDKPSWRGINIGYSKYKDFKNYLTDEDLRLGYQNGGILLDNFITVLLVEEPIVISDFSNIRKMLKK